MLTAGHFIEKTNSWPNKCILHSHTAVMVKQFLVRTKYWCTLLFLPSALDFTSHISCFTAWLVLDFPVALLVQTMKFLYGESDLQDVCHQKITQKKLDKLSCLQWPLNLHLSF